ncbi:MAG: hypothetical protein AAGA30_06540, partial [Planctomycetota bacterium]
RVEFTQVNCNNLHTFIRVLVEFGQTLFYQPWNFHGFFIPLCELAQQPSKKIPENHLAAAVAVAIFSLLIGTFFTTVIKEDFSSAVYIFAGPGILAIVAVAAIVSYVLQNRILFFAGTVGAFSGPFIVGEFRSTGGFVFNAEMTASGWQICGWVASAILSTIVFELQRRVVKIQYSIAFLLIITLLVSLVLAL